MGKAFSVEELAARWGVERRDVEEELDSGRLPFFSVNGKRRITADAVARFEGQAAPAAEEGKMPLHPERPTLRPAPPFRHRWPDGEDEEYAHSFEGNTSNAGYPVEVRIGFGTRRTVGRERRHVVVFLGGRRSDREGRVAGRPIVEFAGVDDYDQSKQVASLIKTRGGREVRSPAEVPEGYEGFEVLPYNSVITGPYAHSGLALILRDDDLEGMLRHALIRARSMGLLR